MRHYLLNERKIGPRLKAEVVLAETATQLYRDTAYHDLITFEEDIAKIATMVLIIAESPGSLAELGAFASIETIRRSVTILMQEKYANAETFIRFGPVERIKNEGDGRVAFFPWKTHNNGKVNKSSASPHVRNIIKFINERLSKVPNITLISNNPDLKSFVILYWILYLSLAMPLGKLTSYARNMIDNLDDRGVRSKLYCMQLAGWINKKHYSNEDYYYCCHDVDPIHYIFRRDVAERVSIRRKADVVAAIQRDLSLPRYIKEVVFENRKPQPR